jgi:alpha-L-rhamnosidase
VYDLWIMMQVAALLGNQQDAARFEEMYRERKEFFNTRFVNEEGKTMALFTERGFGFGPSGPPGYRVADTQTSYAVGLALGAFNDDVIPQMADHLATTVESQNEDDQGVLRPEYSLMTGFIGTAWISKALSDNGYNEQAYKLLQNNKYPSWLYSIDQGATTIWERLNGYTVENGFGGNNSMNSFNHYSFGAVGQWMIAYSLGIQRDKPGFRAFILQPTTDPTGEMTWAEGYYDSPYGRIESRWEMVDGKLVYEATIPANTSATLYLPAISPEEVTESGIPAGDAEGVTFISFENEKAVYHMQSGKYRIEAVQ